MTFDAFLETAWNDHGDRPQEVADRLASSLHVVEAAEHIPPFARTSDACLRRASRPMVARNRAAGSAARAAGLRRQRSRPPGALDRNIATLRYAGGDVVALTSLAVADRAFVLASAAAAFAGRGEHHARR